MTTKPPAKTQPEVTYKCTKCGKGTTFIGHLPDSRLSHSRYTGWGNTGPTCDGRLVEEVES